MWDIIIAISSTIVILLIERPYLRKNKEHKKDRWIFFVTLVFGNILLIMYGLGFQLPTPLDWLTSLLKPISIKLHLI